MADKSANSKYTLPPNVKIKVEPGTSMPVSVRNIKIEPGLSSTTTTTTRLTSFRLPRDLTLGGSIKTEKPKKIYTPNLNAQRNKRKEDVTVKNEPGHTHRGRERGRGRGERGRGRGSSNLIQSTGIWSEGNKALPVGGRRSSSLRDSNDKAPAAASLERPKLDLHRTINKAEEEEKLKALLRDDFIDDGEYIDLDNAPVILPMIEEVKLYKEEAKAEVQSDGEIDKKPIILENGEVLKPKKELKIKVPVIDTKAKPNLPSTVPQVIETKANSYMLIQFPDCLPGLESSDADVKPNESKPKSEYCTLNTLKPGMLGKLQILKSGKARLLLGENNLIMDVGSHLSFRQDLIAAKVDTVKLTGDLINLGSVNSTLICSPDWETMLAKL